MPDPESTDNNFDIAKNRFIRGTVRPGSNHKRSTKNNQSIQANLNGRLKRLPELIERASAGLPLFD
jgi:hypothetical protein